MAPSRPHRDAPLQQQTPDLVHHCRTSHDPAFTHSMQRLHVQLFIGLDRHKAHRGTAHSFSDCFCINEVVLVGLHKRLYILRGHQPYFMDLCAKSPAQEMRARAGFHPNQSNLDVRGKAKKLGARELFPHHHFSCLVENYEVKNGLAQIDADRVQFHGKSPSSSLYPSESKAADTISYCFGNSLQCTMNQLTDAG